MKRILPLVIVLFFAVMLSACLNNTGKPVETTGESSSAAAVTTAAAESTLQTTTEAATTPITAATTRIEFTTTFNPAVVTGRPDPGAGTFTGYEPLPEARFTVIDPDNSRGLSTKATGYSYGLGKNSSQPAESLRNQATFDKYNALAIDTKSTGKVLRLTFDCGYENGYTGKILDTLKAKNVPAAFFCTLPYIKQQPALVTRMIKEGHIVGNHSDTHPVFPSISRTQMATEIRNCDNYLRLKFGYSAPYFRFPTGSYSDSALDLVQSVGFRSVFWSLAYKDWETNNQQGAQYAFDTVTARLHPGAVILLHAVSSDNAAALGDIIDRAKGQGYQFVSL